MGALSPTICALCVHRNNGQAREYYEDELPEDEEGGWLCKEPRKAILSWVFLSTLIGVVYAEISAMLFS